MPQSTTMWTRHIALMPLNMFWWSTVRKRPPPLLLLLLHHINDSNKFIETTGRYNIWDRHVLACSTGLFQNLFFIKHFQFRAVRLPSVVLWTLLNTKLLNWYIYYYFFLYFLFINRSKPMMNMNILYRVNGTDHVHHQVTVELINFRQSNVPCPSNNSTLKSMTLSTTYFLLKFISII